MKRIICEDWTVPSVVQALIAARERALNEAPVPEHCALRRLRDERQARAENTTDAHAPHRYSARAAFHAVRPAHGCPQDELPVNCRGFRGVGPLRESARSRCVDCRY